MHAFIFANYNFDAAIIRLYHIIVLRKNLLVRDILSSNWLIRSEEKWHSRRLSAERIES